jgi:signal transduction histidine kinase
MSVIAIQAEAAPYRVETPPPELAESFAKIRGNALDGLNELRRILGVLRAEDATGETAPQPGFDRLDELVDAAVAGGLSVSVKTVGQRRAVPPGVELAAFRILQEALSNAMRHAPGAAVRVEMRYDADGLRLIVVNGPGRHVSPDDRPSAGSGHGLVGMRERVTMTGGELRVEPTADGGYAVNARLPLPESEAR